MIFDSKRALAGLNEKEVDGLLAKFDAFAVLVEDVHGDDLDNDECDTDADEK